MFSFMVVETSRQEGGTMMHQEGVFNDDPGGAQLKQVFKEIKTEAPTSQWIGFVGRIETGKPHS